MKLSQKIKEARERNNVTQKELADAIGVGRLHITKIENGQQIPSVICLLKIAEALNMKQIKKALRGIFQ